VSELRLLAEPEGRHRLDIFTAWLPRLGIVLAFLFIGSTKFNDDPRGEWFKIFEQIGLGQWFRHFTGGMQVTGALLLLTPWTRTLGAAMLGGTIYDLPPGQSICPYHYEYGNEEWLVVLAGTALLRHPGGEEELEPGDTICFPVGPDGAHKVTNRTDELVRVLMLSTKNQPNAAVYPDSDKIGVWPGNEADAAVFRRSTAVPYSDGEEGWEIAG
jgi:uncharacterized cupin superfamily protein